MAKVVVEAESRDVNVYTDDAKTKVILLSKKDEESPQPVVMGILGGRYQMEYLLPDPIGPAVVAEAFNIFEERSRQAEVPEHTRRRSTFTVLRRRKEDS